MSIKVLKISLCGDKKVGKSFIAHRLTNQEPYLDYISTIGVDFFARRLPKCGIRMNIWDLGGDPRFRGITYPYIKGSNLLLYVYDMTREETICTLKDLHKTFSKKKLSCAKVIVIGNKSDEVDSRCDCSEQGEKFASSINALHLTVSARNNVGIESILETIMKMFEIDENSKYEEDEEDEEKEETSWGEDIVRECRECAIL